MAQSFRSFVKINPCFLLTLLLIFATSHRIHESAAEASAKPKERATDTEVFRNHIDQNDTKGEQELSAISHDIPTKSPPSSKSSWYENIEQSSRNIQSKPITLLKQDKADLDVFKKESLKPRRRRRGVSKKKDDVGLKSINLSQANSQLTFAASPLYTRDNCVYPGYTGFERAITPAKLYEILKVQTNLISYNGKRSFSQEVADEIHRHIACAIQQDSRFSSFANTAYELQNGLKLDLIEIAAFLAHVSVETSGFSDFEEVTDQRYCYAEESAYACSENDVSYKGRGPLKIRGNNEYGKLSDFLFGDSGAKLLGYPHLIEPTGISGWVAALWRWMTPIKYGYKCPSTFMKTGEASCHSAIQNLYGSTQISVKSPAEAILGFGLSISLLAGDECCLSKNSIARNIPATDVALLQDAAMISIMDRDLSRKDEVEGTASNDGFEDFMSAQAPQESGTSNTSTTNKSSGTASPQAPQVSPKLRGDTTSTEQVQQKFKAGLRVTEFLRIAYKLDAFKNNANLVFLPGSPDCTLSKNSICASIVSGCPYLFHRLSSAENKTCSFTCKLHALKTKNKTSSTQTVAPGPTKDATVGRQLESCGYSCQ